MSNQNRIFGNIDHALPNLCEDVMRGGEEVGSRLGDRVMERISMSVTLERPWERYITLQSRRANVAAQIAETMWVLDGRDDIGWLSHYLPRAKDFSDDGRTWRGAYGPRIQRQLDHVVGLLQKDRTSRRAVISIYDPGMDMYGAKDVPCNTQLQFLSRLGSLEMIVTTRSNDLVWGWSGINTFEWSVLQEIVAYRLGVRPGRIHFNIGSLHIYDRHWERARGMTQAAYVNGSKLHHADFSPPSGWTLQGLTAQWFDVEKRVRLQPNLASTAEAIAEFPEPMMRDWLRVLHWWWTGNERYMSQISGTDLHTAAIVGLQPPDRTHGTSPDKEDANVADFISEVDMLHREKDAAYGISWCKRGEQIGILANIARKIDRLGAEGGGDTSTDTAIDLLVYTLKYIDWFEYGTDQGTGPKHCDRVLQHLVDFRDSSDLPDLEYRDHERKLQDKFQSLELAVSSSPTTGQKYTPEYRRKALAEDMAEVALEYAYHKWMADQ